MTGQQESFNFDAPRQRVKNRLGATEIRFDGAAFEAKHDQARLTGQILRVFEVMKSGRWLTLQELADLTGDPHASCSAQLRNLRKSRFGAHQVEKRARGNREAGLFEYRLAVRAEAI